jgi:hypothetical protein
MCLEKTFKSSCEVKQSILWIIGSDEHHGIMPPERDDAQRVALNELKLNSLTFLSMSR